VDFEFLVFVQEPLGGGNRRKMSAEDTLFVNRILVLITFFVMITSIASCVIMYVFRDYRKRESSPTNGGFSNRRRTDSSQSRQPSFSDKIAAEPKYQTGTFVRRSGSSRSQSSDSSLQESVERDLEKEPLMVTPNSVADDEETERRNLNESIEVALNVGVTLTLHTVKNSRSAKISLADGTLTCRVRKGMSLKVVPIGLNEITSILAGKKTPNYQRSALQNIPDDVCFSIVTDSKTLDFEAMFKTERDALVAGLQILIERYKSTRFDDV
jgi:hypothetical protein